MNTSNSPERLSSAINRYSKWLSEEVVPLWSSKGIDQQGASYEQLLSNGAPDTNANKRIRVQARQMFSFSYGHHQGWLSNGAELISNIDQFIERYAKKEGDNIYAHVLDSQNQVINSSKDLYDCAFFLLAYGWRYHAFNDLKALSRAEKLLQQIDRDLKTYPGGWSEGDYDAVFRRQNPHMHMFEAFLTLYQVTKKGKWLAKAGEIFCLFETCFFDHKAGVLLEYFDDDWSPAEKDGNIIVEPGHMMEWVWLLRQYEKLTDTPVDKYCHSLYHNALKFGLDRDTKTLVDETNIDGNILKATKRCWPMTEWVKASLAQASAYSTSPYNYLEDARIAIESLMFNYTKGNLYIDQLGEKNEIKVDTAPASTLYHLIMAEGEAKRFLKGNHHVY